MKPITKEGRYYAEHMAMMYADLARAAGCTNIKWWLADEATDDGDIHIGLSWTPPNVVYISLDEMARSNNPRNKRPYPQILWPKEES